MFDIGRLLVDVFKDPTHCHAMLEGYNYEITFPAVYQWFYRNALPSKWVLVLLAIRELEYGQPVALAPYLR